MVLIQLTTQIHLGGLYHTTGPTPSKPTTQTQNGDQTVATTSTCSSNLVSSSIELSLSHPEAIEKRSHFLVVYLFDQLYQPISEPSILISTLSLAAVECKFTCRVKG